MFEELQSWWESTTPETQAALQQGSIVVAALVGGYILSAMTARILSNAKFDASLRLPGAAPDAEHRISPSTIVGFLVCLSVWAAAGWWMARQHGQVDLAGTLKTIIVRTWGLATLVVVFLALGSLLARRLIDCLQSPPPATTEPTRFQTSEAAKALEIGGRGVAGAVGAGAYILVLVLVLLMAADSFDWPLTRSAAVALWQFAQHLLLAVAALFIGALGARWARDMITTESAVSLEKRVGQYTAMGLVAATTVLAVAVVLFGAGVLIVVATLVVVGLLAWSVRSYVPDVAAGWQLRAYKIAEVRFDGEPWTVVETGLLTTVLGKGGEFARLKNRAVLDACMHTTQS